MNVLHHKSNNAGMIFIKRKSWIITAPIDYICTLFIFCRTVRSLTHRLFRRITNGGISLLRRIQHIGQSESSYAACVTLKWESQHFHFFVEKSDVDFKLKYLRVGSSDFRIPSMPGNVGPKMWPQSNQNQKNGFCAISCEGDLGEKRTLSSIT